MVTIEDVKRMAKLAHIHVSEDEAQILLKKFSAIIDHFNVLSKVDTEGVEPLFHFTEAMPLREDEAVASLSTVDVMSNAPDSFEDEYRLPRVLAGIES